MAVMWTDRRALVTGASSGIGLEIARALAGEGANLILPVRDRGRGNAARDSIRRSHPAAQVEITDLDLARLSSMSAFAERMLERGEPIGLLVLNAGVVMLGDTERHVTEDGFERHFQTNFLAHVALTEALLPLLCAGRAHIAIQLSLAAARGRLDDLQSERRYRPLRAYAASKRALGLYGVALARRCDEEGLGVRVNLCHPGVVPATGIAADMRTGAPSSVARIVGAVGNSPARAAEPALAALASDDSCRFFAPRGPLGLSGAPRERRLYAAIADPGEAERICEQADRMLAAGRPRR